jgi:Dual specificity phosphatase, catalytic domain
MASQILENLYLGDWQDGKSAKFQGWDTLCVIETQPWDKYKGMTYYVPILDHDEHSLAFISPRALLTQLDHCSDIIDKYVNFEGGDPLLVHCYAGVERSPLTLAYWLVKSKRYPNLDEAYKFLKSKRPIVEDRRAWLPLSLANNL